MRGAFIVERLFRSTFFKWSAWRVRAGVYYVRTAHVSAHIMCYEAKFEMRSAENLKIMNTVQK